MMMHQLHCGLSRPPPRLITHNGRRPIRAGSRLVARCCANGQHQDNGPPIVQTSVLFYTAMTGAAVALGQAFDMPVGPQLLDSIQLVHTTAAVGILVAVALAMQRYTEQIPALKEIETLMRITLLPALRTSPWWVRAAGIYEAHCMSDQSSLTTLPGSAAAGLGGGRR